MRVRGRVRVGVRVTLRVERAERTASTRRERRCRLSAVPPLSPAPRPLALRRSTRRRHSTLRASGRGSGRGEGEREEDRVRARARVRVGARARVGAAAESRLWTSGQHARRRPASRRPRRPRACSWERRPRPCPRRGRAEARRPRPAASRDAGARAPAPCLQCVAACSLDGMLTGWHAHWVAANCPLIQWRLLGGCLAAAWRLGGG